MTNILKGKKYRLIEEANIKMLIEYLKEYRPQTYKNCYYIDNIGWFIPADALDHIIGDC